MPTVLSPFVHVVDLVNMREKRRFRAIAGLAVKSGPSMQAEGASNGKRGNLLPGATLFDEPLMFSFRQMWQTAGRDAEAQATASERQPSQRKQSEAAFEGYHDRAFALIIALRCSRAAQRSENSGARRRARNAKGIAT